MRLIPLATFVLAATSAVATPAAAASDGLVEFRYKAGELATEDGRAALLKRVRVTTLIECRKSAPSWSTVSCQNDLERQLVHAIGGSEFIALHRGSVTKIARRGD